MTHFFSGLHSLCGIAPGHTVAMEETFRNVSQQLGMRMTSWSSMGLHSAVSASDMYSGDDKLETPTGVFKVVFTCNLWNQLPNNLRPAAAGSAAFFERTLKTHLMKDGFVK